MHALPLATRDPKSVFSIQQTEKYKMAAAEREAWPHIAPHNDEGKWREEAEDRKRMKRVKTTNNVNDTSIWRRSMLCVEVSWNTQCFTVPLKKALMLLFKEDGRRRSGSPVLVRVKVRRQPAATWGLNQCAAVWRDFTCTFNGLLRGGCQHRRKRTQKAPPTHTHTEAGGRQKRFYICDSKTESQKRIAKQMVISHV